MTQAVRDDADAYARYLQGMDASMRVKVALTAAHVLRGGRAADMGMGSGASSAALAGLYPGLEVVGVDVDPVLVERARREYTLPNLSFMLGDIAARVLPPESMDTIFNSSVLHHVTSFGGYDRPAALRAVAVQAEALRLGGVIVIRDFVDPQNADAQVFLDLRTTDVAEDGASPDCPDASLLERFASQFRALSDAPGFPLECVPGAPAGWRRYRLAHRHAVEFLLRKDYRADWEAESREEYGIGTVAEIAAGLGRLGFRVLVASPIRNPWIVRHRLVDRYRMTDAAGGVLDHPATNAVFVAQRVAPGSGVRFEDAGAAKPTGFLTCVHHRDVRTGQPRDLVRRPGVTIDIIPYFTGPEGVQVVFASTTPRPVAVTALATPAPCGALPQFWVAEPLHARMADLPVGSTVERALAAVGLGAERIRSLHDGVAYDPSPGGIQEEVRSVFAEIEPLVAASYSAAAPFQQDGRLQAAAGLQLLRAGMVGGLFDARLEINVRWLLARLGIAAGPWLGDVAPLEEGPGLPVTPIESLLARPRRRVFLEADVPAGFLTLESRRFRQVDAAGRVIDEQVLDVVTPTWLSTISVAVLPLARFDGVVHAGVVDDDLPSTQAFTGASNLLVAPAFRIPHAYAGSLHRMQGFVAERLNAEYGLETRELFELGGRYGPSPGMTPEVVYPYGARVVASHRASGLHWVALGQLAKNDAALRDGHLRILAGRAAHAYEVA